jgi:hypothetical protein
VIKKESYILKHVPLYFQGVRGVPGVFPVDRVFGVVRGVFELLRQSGSSL